MLIKPPNDNPYLDAYGSFDPFEYRDLRRIDSEIDRRVRERVEEEIYKREQRQRAAWNLSNFPPSIFGMNMTSPEEVIRQAEAKAAKLAAFQATIASLEQKKPKMVKQKHIMPDYTSTLVGWRGWKVNGDRLHALGTSEFWTAKKAVRAKCSSGSPKGHPSPSKDCTCGYWSFHSIELLTEALQPYIGSAIVLGTVDLWGRVIECENGYRSEYAYPKELWLLGEGLEFLSYTYGVPIRKV